MLHVYFGTDRQEVRNAATQFCDKYLPPDGTLTILDAAEYQTNQLTDALGAASLFGGVEWFLVDSPADNADFLNEVQENVAAMAESSNTFIILEGALLAAAKKTYTKHAAHIEEFVAEKQPRLNPFSMTDALAEKNRRQLWVLLHEMRLNGLPAEELIGILWWQLKALRLAELTTSAADAGMKDFPYNKAKRALTKFSAGEIQKLSYTLLSVYHDGHAGVRDIDLALERWVLSGR